MVPYSSRVAKRGSFYLMDISSFNYYKTLKYLKCFLFLIIFFVVLRI